MGSIMQVTNAKQLSDFYIAGINYRKADASLRGQFAINDQQYQAILQRAPQYGINEMFILSTCNRTEIYGFASDAKQLSALLCSETKASAETFYQSAYFKNGKAALEHLYQVAAGLDSQVLGDYEIVGQLRTAARLAKAHGYIGASLERMVNAALQSSKMIKNQTHLSGGTVSVSFSAIQYIKQQVKDIASKKILLVGIGKIGLNTCKNIVDYLQTRNVVLINRSPNKAMALASELGLQHAPFEDINKELETADIILVATNAGKPIILKHQLAHAGVKIIIDLSIPYNVEEAAGSLPNVTLVNVDELAKLKDETLAKRMAEVPKAKAIIAESIIDILNWYEMRKHVPVLTAVKLKLKEIHALPMQGDETIHAVSVPCKKTEARIQKILNGMACKMRSQNQRGCNYIEAINEFLAPPSKN